jgi:Integrase core domain
MGLCEWRDTELLATRRADENAFVESFNGRLRDECLNAHWFLCWPTQRPRSRRGGGITMRAVFTLPWGG